MSRLLECIPNFSEGQNPETLDLIAAAIRKVSGVKLLHIDPGYSANRTVFTFAGEPEAVIEAAFQAMKVAAEHIDMSQHTGTHPRMGATDVCPLVPVRGISIEEAAVLAHQLGKRVGNELGIPVYMYEKTASAPYRSNLAVIRAGEYEGFREKIMLPKWKPDYGPQQFNPRSGQTVIGVRDFLIAYNMNLNTRSVKLANSVAFDVRERGRIQTIDGKPGSPPMRDQEGKALRKPGLCKGVKAIGWYIEEFGSTQVSTNLTDIAATALHDLFEATRNSARNRGLRVTGSELIGLIPEKCLTDAGTYYLEQQGVSEKVPKEELVHIAIKTLGLAELAPFDPHEKILEWNLERL